MCCTLLAESTKRKKIDKNLSSGHHRTTLSGSIFATKKLIDRRKNLLNSNISSICPHNMTNFGTLTAEICLPVWGTTANSTGFASCCRYCSDVFHRRPTQLCMMFGRLLRWYNIIYIFRGFLPPDGILPGAKFTLRPRLLFSYIGIVTAGHSSSSGLYLRN